MAFGFRLVALAAIIGSAQPQPRASRPTQEASLKTFLQSFDDMRIHDDKTTRYVAAYYDLNGDGTPEVIVYLTSRDWCGSGGCRLLILEHDKSSWKIVTEVSITRPPIRVLSNIAHGWHSISVLVQGGGIHPGYQAELRFDGKTYPSNPSVPPARPLVGRVPGHIVISRSQAGISLYP